MRFCTICVSNWAWMHHPITFSWFLDANFYSSPLFVHSCQCSILCKWLMPTFESHAMLAIFHSIYLSRASTIFAAVSQTRNVHTKYALSNAPHSTIHGCIHWHIHFSFAILLFDLLRLRSRFICVTVSVVVLLSVKHA